MRSQFFKLPGWAVCLLWASGSRAGAPAEATAPSPSGACLADLPASVIAQRLGKDFAKSQDPQYADFVVSQVEKLDLDGDAVLEVFQLLSGNELLNFVSKLLPDGASQGACLRLVRRFRALVKSAPGGGCAASAAELAATVGSEAGGCSDEPPPGPAATSLVFGGSPASGRALAAAGAEREPRGPMHEANLLRSLLDESRYDRLVPPPNLNSNGGVQLGVNFFKIVNVDLKSSVVTLGAWLRLEWVDERLRFNASEGLGPFVIPANMGETGRIWVPDVELYNSEQPIATTLAETSAIVRPDGSVQWSRLGTMKVLCKFKGLVTFPMDTLVCHLEFGAWSLPSQRQDIILRKVDGGVQFDPQDADGTSVTAGSTFQDYYIQNVSVSTFTSTYDCCPNETWPQILYEMTVGRAITFYVMKLIVPQVSMALLSLLTYFMNPEIGERLGFGVTLVLAVIATDIVASELSPVCSELLLIDLISRACLFFCVFALFETGVVLFLYHLEIFDFQELLPRCCRHRKAKSSKGDMLQSLLRREFMCQSVTEGFAGMMRNTSSLMDFFASCPEQEQEQEEEEKDGADDSEGDKSGAGSIEGGDANTERDANKEDLQERVVDMPQTPPPPPLPHGVLPGAFIAQAPCSPPDILPMKQVCIKSCDASSNSSPPASPKRDARSFKSNSSLRRIISSGKISVSGASCTSKVSKVSASALSEAPALQHGTVQQRTANTTAEDTKMDYRLRLQAYREAFYILDDDFSGLLERNEVNSFGLFMLGDDWSEDMLDSFLESADLDGSGGLSLQEFSDFCESTICDSNGNTGSTALSFVRDMVKGFIAITRTRQEMTNAMWQSRALAIDKICRFWVPFSFLLTTLSILVWSLFELFV